MLHYLIKKPYLKDLIPSGHVDFHSHLLPGIDDGSKSDADTLQLVSNLEKLGFEQFITTPHVMKNVWENTYDSISEKAAATQELLKKNGFEMPFKAAAEYLIDGNFSELMQNGPLLALNEKHVLVEMSYINPPIQLYDILFDMQVAGYKPVLAHPERYLAYHHNFDEYEKLKHAGCQFQLNLLSVVGYYGEEVAAVAEKLLKKGFIDFAGSDVHHQNHIDAFSKKLLFKDTTSLSEALAHNQFFRF